MSLCICRVGDDCVCVDRPKLLDEIETLRAKLAEVEKERDALHAQHCVDLDQLFFASQAAAHPKPDTFDDDMHPDIAAAARKQDKR